MKQSPLLKFKFVRQSLLLKLQKSQQFQMLYKCNFIWLPVSDGAAPAVKKMDMNVPRLTSQQKHSATSFNITTVKLS